MSSTLNKIHTGHSLNIDPRTEPPTATPMPILDQAILRLREGALSLLRLSLNERIHLAEAMQAGYLRIARRSVEIGGKAKGIAPGSPTEGEEWATGPWAVIRHLRLIRESLQSIRRHGNTPIGPVRRTDDGRLSVRCFPGNAIDGVLFKNVTVDVRMQAGVTEQKLEESRASFYKRPGHTGTVVLVLGAGNIACIPSMDVVTKIFNEGKVCLLKMNPVNAYIGPLIEDAFSEAVRQGFLAVVYGGADEGAYLVQHESVDEIHITGSDRTHDAIVWGAAGPDRDARLRHRTPLLNKPITSELGNISPVILVPGPYSEKELRFQAEDAASSMVMNASFYCNSAKMLVTPRNWQGSDRFLQGIQDVLAVVTPRRAYYPGAHARWRLLTAGRNNTRMIGTAANDALP